MRKSGPFHDGVKPALLVIDVQNYFFDRGSSAFLTESPRILPRINRLIASARKRRWPVIYTTHRAPTGKGNLIAQRWEHLPNGAESKLFSGLRRQRGETVVEKEHYSAFMGTDLGKRLAANGVGQIILCGAMTHLCVDTTARHGFMLGFWPVIVSDACCSKDGEYHRAALRCLKHGFADFVTTAKLTRFLQCET